MATCDHWSPSDHPATLPPSMQHTGNNVIRLLSNGIVSTYAGNGTSGYSNGAASSAMFSLPTGVGTDPSGQVYVADTVSASACSIATTVLSCMVSSHIKPYQAVSSHMVSSHRLLLFHQLSRPAPASPFVVACCCSSAQANQVIRVVSSGIVSTLAGTGGQAGIVDGPSSGALFNSPQVQT